MTAWGQWLQHPKKLWLRKALFKIHLCVGVGVGVYILLMSVSGSMIVYRNEFSESSSMEWLVNLHGNLLSGSTGRLVNGIGGICATLLSLTGVILWWPGIRSWRRRLTVNWRAPLARNVWDLHSALGFWCFLPILVWGTSGIYFSFPQIASPLFLIDPHDRFADEGLFWLSEVHFGRFGWFSKALWALFGIGPALLAVTGAFVYGRGAFKRAWRRGLTRDCPPATAEPGLPEAYR